MQHLITIAILFACYGTTPCTYVDQVVFPTVGSEDAGMKTVVHSQTVVIGGAAGGASGQADVAGVAAFPLASEAVNGVAARLHTLIDPSGKKNYVVSPFSVAVIVGQLMLGARGATQQRLRQLVSPSRSARRRPETGDDELHRQLGGLLQSLRRPAAAVDGESADPEALLKLHADSALFHNKDIRLNEQFQADTKKYYDSELKPLDFKGNAGGAQRHINEWVSRNTEGVFSAILPGPLPKSTSALFVNTLYFKAAWLTPFDRDLTVTKPFHLNGTHLIDVNYMRGQFDINYVDSDELRCRLIILPYKQKDVNMYVVLPHKHLDMDIKAFAETLTPNAIASLVNATTEESVTVVLPRMSLKTKFSLKEPIARYRPVDTVSSRLGDEDDQIMWKVVRKNTTSSGNKTYSGRPTTQRAPTTRQRKPTSTQPPRATKPIASQEQEQDEDTTVKAPKRPSQNKPTTSRYRPSTTTAKPRPTAAATTTTKKPSSINTDGDVFQFDMSGASNDIQFNIEDIVHQISLEVNEVGTEAAAVSVVEVNYSGDIRVVKMDRPFVFFIRHEPSLTNLFWGVITDPTNGDYD